jgi:transcriptional regulator GlxA family with amidase domain
MIGDKTNASASQQSSLLELERKSATGFSDPRRMREVFVRAFGQSPQVFRRNARTSAKAT